MDLRGAQRAGELGGDELLAVTLGKQRQHLGLTRRELPVARRRDDARAEVAMRRAPDHQPRRGLATHRDRRRLEAGGRAFGQVASERLLTCRTPRGRDFRSAMRLPRR